MSDSKAGDYPVLSAETVAAGFAASAADFNRFNLAIFGTTGVGKSTLLNAIFGAEVARTGIGDPVTQGSFLHRHESSKIGIFDTKGLELGTDTDAVLAELRTFIHANRLGDVADQIHVIWYCIRAGDLRIHPAEEDFIREVAALQIPLVLVFTQTPIANSGDGSGTLHSKAQQLVDEVTALRLPIRGGVHLVNALGDSFDDIAPFGLEELLATTVAVAPEGVQNALAAAQRINQQQKRDRAQLLVSEAMQRLTGRTFLGEIGTVWARLFAGIGAIYDLPEPQVREVLEQVRAIDWLRRSLRVGNSGGFVLVWGTVPGLTARAVQKLRNSRSKNKQPQSASDSTKRMGTGMAAGPVTEAIGESWINTCEHFWTLPQSSSKTSSADTEAIAQYFGDDLHERLPKVLQLWQEHLDRRANK